MANTDQAQQLAPYTQEGEEAVLGSILVDPESFDSVNGIITAEDFYILRHVYIWEAFTRIRRRDEVIDFVTAMAELSAMNRLNDIGGPAYLIHLTNSTPTSVHAMIYAHLVQRAAERRRLLIYADEVKALAMDEQLSQEKVRTSVVERLHNTHLGKGEQRLTHIGTALGEYMGFVEEASKTAEGTITGIPTGFVEIDQKTDGFQPGSLNILGARPKMGKSALIMAIILQLARLIAENKLTQSSGRWIYLWTGEMPVRQVCARLISAEMEVDARLLRRGMRRDGLSRFQWGKFVEKVGGLGGLPIVFDETIGISPIQMRQHLAEGVRYYGPLALIGADYLGLMTPDDQRATREQQVSSISRTMKEMAREYAPILSAHQLNRELEKRQDKRPVPSDLRDSGALEQDADLVTFLYRDVVYNPGTKEKQRAEWIWSYNRHGPTGTHYLGFDSKHTRFYEPKPEHVVTDQQMALITGKETPGTALGKDAAAGNGD